jgi:hypothetical protein
MATSGTIMAPRLTNNDVNSSQIDHQVTCLTSKAREARNMTFQLRQRHFDMMLKYAGPASQVYGGLRLRGTGSREGVPSQGAQAFGPGLPLPWGFDCPPFSGRLEDLEEFRRTWEEYERVHYPKEPEGLLVELLHNHALGSELKEIVSQARSMEVTWTCLEDHLREQRVRIDNLLSRTLKTAQPVGNDRVFLYYWGVCLFLDTPEGRSTVGDYIILDQLDMLLSLLPTEETNLWGMSMLNVSQESIPETFCEFCRERASELKLQVLTPERNRKLAQVLAQSHDGSSWKGPCMLGDLCRENHMPEECHLFEEMTPESQLAIFQKTGYVISASGTPIVSPVPPTQCRG